MAIFFDLDGTLLDIRRRYLAVYRDLLTSADLTPLGDDACWQLKREGHSLPEILDRSGAGSRSEELVAQYVTMIEARDYLARDRLWPGIDDLLGRASERTPLYVVTLRRQAENLHWQLDALGIARWFREVLCAPAGESASHTKARMIERVGHDAQRDLVAGDLDSDILAARSLGLSTCAAAYGVRTEERLAQLGPDHLARTPADLVTMIESHLDGLSEVRPA